MKTGCWLSSLLSASVLLQGRSCCAAAFAGEASSARRASLQGTLKDVQGGSALREEEEGHRRGNADELLLSRSRWVPRQQQQRTRRAQEVPTFEVVVIGAGWAGLGAANALKDRSLLVLEGRNYVGGRSRTVTFADGTPVELGSGWIHGASSGNAVYRVAQMSGMGVIVPTSDEVNYWSDAYQDDAPHLVNQDDVEPIIESYLEGFEQFLDSYPDDDPQDMPLSDAAAEYALEEGIAGDNELVYDLALDSSIVAEYAASLEDLSRWWWNEDGEPLPGGDAVIGRGGYSGAISWFAQNVTDKIRLGANVTAVDWSDPSAVAVTYAQNGTLHTVNAQRVVVTVPLGVLKRGAIAFQPDLPQSKKQAIDNLGMGLLNKCIMKWNSSATLPWPSDLGWMERIAPLGEQGKWTEFFSLQRDTKQKVVIGFTAGREAERVEQLGDDDIKEEVMASLAAMFGDGVVPPPEEWIISRWLADEWSRGSYSYHAVGSGPDDRRALAEPVDGRLFFAGEATHLEFMSTTHGALSSGMSAGSMVLEAILAADAESSAAWTAGVACAAATTVLATLFLAAN